VRHEELNILYKELDFQGGDLCPAVDNPSDCEKDIDWLEKGEWLAAAKRAGAETLFFVENNPVAVFAHCNGSLEEKVKAFNRVWCLARPRLFFLASPGEITVYDLVQKPVNEKKQQEWKKLKTLAALKDLGKVTRKLQEYHRDHVESGRVFADKRFGDLKNRADKSLIRDLKTVRRELIHAGLSGDKVGFAHALIGRSIFIRYLEDRGILTEEYFLNIAGQKAGRIDLLRNPVKRQGLDFSNDTTFYPLVLEDKDFTYALFRRLARDFNGDMFPDVDEEEKAVNEDHLKLIQDLLYGDAGIRKKLFFYSYRFDIVPLDLISSIYEEFYHLSSDDSEKKNKRRPGGAFYTPPVLVEFILSRVLSPDVLERTPRVLDPGCGSGIFLVEAFRRIVRYEWHKNKQPLTFNLLKRILKDQIAGIEVNEEAARIAAFSLYLSMLHYLSPPAIDKQLKLGNRLPNLLAADNRSANNFHCILPVNTFEIKRIHSNATWSKRFGNGCADVVVGNPPWGAPGTKAAQEIKAQHKIVVDWCQTNNKPIGDKEQSQAFLWRSLDFLKENGKAGMLVSAGVLFKHNKTTLAFRNRWLYHIALDEVFNFTHVRKFFFEGANSPFISICFRKERQENSTVNYWSAKQTLNTNKTQSIVFSKGDMHVLHPEDIEGPTVWKELWFGRMADRKFLRFLKSQTKLLQFSDREKCGRGYEIVSKTKLADALQPFKNIDINSFSRYGPIKFCTPVDPPPKVYRLGNIDVYDGHRLLIQRGIDEKSNIKGKIVARYEEKPFCFTNALIGIKLKSPEEWKFKTILGILWSSVARYFFFMTSSNWGLWHHEIHLEDELLQLPIILDQSIPATKEIISLVENLSDYNPQKKDILHQDGVPENEIEARRRQWESELDEAVFQLYGLNEEEIDLIRDLCDVTLPFYYKPLNSPGAMQAIEKNDYSWIEKYVHIFCRRWNPYLGDDEEMRAEVHIGAHGNMVAVEFFPSDAGDSWNLEPRDGTWGDILEQIGKTLPQPMGTSQVLLDGLVHIVSDTGIIIIKRNVKRFWTRSLAREDADAAICKHMQTAASASSRARLN
jgi:hypothetical protein